MIVLDTHAWLWHVSAPARLSPRVRAALEAGEEVGVCTISCWEVAMLERVGRIALDRPLRDWMARALADERVEAIPLSPEVAVDAALLPATFPADPADRIIYASAKRLGARLATKDATLRRFDRDGTVW